MAIAKTEGTCGRCHQTIPVGMSYFWSNANHARYHWKDADGKCNPGALRNAVPGEGESQGETPESTESTVVTPRPVPPASSVDALIDARIDARLAEFTPESTSVDEDTVKRIVATAVAEASIPRRLEIVAPDRPTITVEHPHPYLERTIKLANAGLHLYLWGPAGGGKTTAGQQVARALSRESEIDTLDPTTFRSMVQGYQTPTGEPVSTSFTRCWQAGHVYIADECDNAPGHVQTLFNSALANGHAPLAWGNVPRTEGFAFIGTGNTPGRPTREFPDRRPMSAAFADRLYFVYWPLDEAAECAWAGVQGKPSNIEVPKPRTVSADLWVNWVQRIRAWSRDNAPTLMVTPRASIVGLRALAVGETPDQVADGLVFRGADAEMRRKALSAVPLP